MVGKNLGIATIAGAVVLLVLGYLFYEILLGGFFENNTGTATGVMKESPQFLWLIAGQLFTALLLAIILKWTGVGDAGSAAGAAACVGSLMALGLNFTMLGVANISTLTGAIVDVVVVTVLYAITGAVMGMLLGKGATA